MYRFHGFDVHMNLQTEPYILNYQGPKYAIYENGVNGLGVIC